MCDFLFCYDSHIENTLSKYIKTTNSKTLLQVSNSNFITIKIGTSYRKKYILINFNDSICFMKFVVGKRIHCQTYLIGMCECHVNYTRYCKCIFQNGCIKHIKIFIGKFLPMVREISDHKYKLIDLIKLNTINNNHTVFNSIRLIKFDINNDLILLIFKYGFFEDTIDVVKILLDSIQHVTFEFMDTLINIFKKNINGKDRKYFMDKIKSHTFSLSLMDFVRPVLPTDNVDLFYYIIDELTTILGQIFCDNDTSECDNPDKLNTNFKYDSSKSAEIINYLIYKSLYCPKIFKQLLIDINNINSTRDIINKLVYKDYIEYVAITLDYLGSNSQKFIDEIFLHATSIEMIDLLIDYGADYETIYMGSKIYRLREDILVHTKKLIKSNKN